MSTNCNTCKYLLLPADCAPCNSCVALMPGKFTNWTHPFEADAPKHVIPGIDTKFPVRYEIAADKPIRQKSTLDLVQEATTYGDPVTGHTALIAIENLQTIIARMICRKPVSVQLELLGLDKYTATKEGTENV